MIMIEYVSYKSVNHLEFGASIGETISIFGEPDRQIKDIDGDIELFYKNFTISFNSNNEFIHFGLYPPSIATVNGQKIGWNYEKIKKTIAMDSNPRIDDVGFIILYDLGVTIVDFCTSDDSLSDKTIGFFKKGQFDEFKKQTQPFDGCCPVQPSYTKK